MISPKGFAPVAEIPLESRPVGAVSAFAENSFLQEAYIKHAIIVFRYRQPTANRKMFFRTM